jgi:long-chain fatty acid transport protein
MRKIILSTLAIAATVVVLHAEGYQLNLNSTKQAGMGNAGVALKLGSESMIYNPAGLSFINGSISFAAGVTGVRSYVSYKSGSYEAETDNPLGTPLFFYAGFKISKNLAAGVSLNNPAGNSICWADNWKGANIVQNSSLQAFSVQPTLSFKFLDDKLSIGAGLMMMWGNFSNSKALIPANGLSALVPLVPSLGQYADIVPVSAKLYGDAKMNYGFNVGILFSPIPQLSIGVSYRSKVDLKVDKGNTDINYADTQIQQIIGGLADYGVTIPPLDKGLFSASMPIPSNINFGISFKPSEDFLLTAELQRVGWGVFEELVIQYDEKVGNFKSIVPKNYSNTMIYRIGGQWTAYPKFHVRLGFYYDTTPVNKDRCYSPETPGSNKMAFTGGFSYRPARGLSVDVAFTYSHGAKTTGYFSESPVSSGGFGGDYKVHAFLPSLGLSYCF